MDNAERKRVLAGEIMSISSAALLLHMRYMARAVTRLRMVPGGEGMTCDGVTLTYSPDYILKRYRKGEGLVVHDLIHVLMHCVFRHWSVGEVLEEELWDVSCDIAAEALIARTAPEYLPEEHRTEGAAQLRRFGLDLELLTAERIYRYLRRNGMDSEELERLRGLFSMDDHKLWYRNRRKEYDPEEEPKTVPIGAMNDDPEDPELERMEKPEAGEEAAQEGTEPTKENEGEKQKTEDVPSGSPKEREDRGLEDWLEQHRMDMSEQLEKLWEDIARQMASELESFGKDPGRDSQHLVRVIRDADRDRCNYSAFLRRFAVAGEVMRTDPDSFDVSFYTYGLSLYGNAALIEPLEYKETSLVKEFVVAIDTSGSVSTELVTAFVRKTFSMLKNEESYFSEVNIYIIQCDTEVREAVKLTSSRELDEYIEKMEIKGLGGTDFRPVFEYIDGLISRGELKKLRGMIYFTDGFGEYPAERPAYETAFAFLRDAMGTQEPPEVPPWAIRLVLEEDDILYG